MKDIVLPQLFHAPERTETIVFNQMVPDFTSLVPVRGKLTVKHGVTFLEVLLEADTIVTLTCDRCLQQYNQRLTIDTSELIWLDEVEERAQDYPQEQQLALEDLSETLFSGGSFSPQDWLYEQLCLALPMCYLCGKDCQPPSTSPTSDSLIDSRWQTLEKLKRSI